MPDNTRFLKITIDAIHMAYEYHEPAFQEAAAHAVGILYLVLRGAGASDAEATEDIEQFRAAFDGEPDFMGRVRGVAAAMGEERWARKSGATECEECNGKRN